MQRLRGHGQAVVLRPARDDLPVHGLVGPVRRPVRERVDLPALARLAVFVRVRRLPRLPAHAFGRGDDRRVPAPRVQLREALGVRLRGERHVSRLRIDLFPHAHARAGNRLAGHDVGHVDVQLAAEGVHHDVRIGHEQQRPRAPSLRGRLHDVRARLELRREPHAVVARLMLARVVRRVAPGADDRLARGGDRLDPIAVRVDRIVLRQIDRGDGEGHVLHVAPTEVELLLGRRQKRRRHEDVDGRLHDRLDLPFGIVQVTRLTRLELGDDPAEERERLRVVGLEHRIAVVVHDHGALRGELQPEPVERIVVPLARLSVADDRLQQLARALGALRRAVHQQLIREQVPRVIALLGRRRDGDRVHQHLARRIRRRVGAVRSGRHLPDDAEVVLAGEVEGLAAGPPVERSHVMRVGRGRVPFVQEVAERFLGLGPDAVVIVAGLADQLLEGGLRLLQLRRIGAVIGS